MLDGYSTAQYNSSACMCARVCFLYESFGGGKTGAYAVIDVTVNKEIQNTRTG